MTPPSARQPDDRTVWITGAGKGIGRALARRLAEDGWTIAASARTLKDLESLAEECPPGRVHCFPLDVTDADGSEATVELIEQQLGPLNLVVLNAGNHIPMTAETFSIDDFRALVDTNLMGTVNGLAPVMTRFVARQSGHIAVVASLAGYVGLPTASAYAATKSALISMSEALRPELDAHGVKLTLINPGFVKTPLTDRNDFKMPFLITVDEAVDAIVTGLKNDAFEIRFPWRLALSMRILRVLPYRLFFHLTRRMVRKT
jgi:NADP-dependent 3-hydroxy acid dehydrogenase YdfG